MFLQLNSFCEIKTIIPIEIAILIQQNGLTNYTNFIGIRPIENIPPWSAVNHLN